MLAVVAVFMMVPAGVAEELTADDYMEFWQPIIGSWNMTVESQGETTKGTFLFEMSRNKKCLILCHGGDEPYTQQLQGYDPVSKKQIAFGFTGEGDFWIQTIGVDGMAKGKKAAKGVGGDWEHKIFSSDGKTTTRTSKWTWREMGRNKIVMVWYDIKEDGKVVPGEHIMTLERK
jgi:hypothetical protein